MLSIFFCLFVFSPFNQQQARSQDFLWGGAIPRGDGPDVA